MANKIQKVAILGSGVMGSQIAAHMTNAGIPVLLYDLNDELVNKGLGFAMKIKPAACYPFGVKGPNLPCGWDTLEISGRFWL